MVLFETEGVTRRRWFGRGRDRGAAQSSTHGDGEAEGNAEGHGARLGEVREVVDDASTVRAKGVGDGSDGLVVFPAAEIRAARADERVEVGGG